MAYYDLKKKPSLTKKEGEKELFYPQIITTGTISADELLRFTSQRSGFKKGDMEGVLTSLFDAMTTLINLGMRVELGEFGYFTGKVKGRLVEKKTDIRSASIVFNNVNFRPSAKFRKALNGEVVRVPSVAFRQSSNLSIDKLERMLTDYLDKNSFINIAAYSRLTGRLKWKATQDLKHFEQQGVIVSRGRGNQKHYIKAVENETEV